MTRLNQISSCAGCRLCSSFLSLPYKLHPPAAFSLSAAKGRLLPCSLSGRGWAGWTGAGTCFPGACCQALQGFPELSLRLSALMLFSCPLMYRDFSDNILSRLFSFISSGSLISTVASRSSALWYSPFSKYSPASLMVLV